MIKELSENWASHSKLIASTVLASEVLQKCQMLFRDETLQESDVEQILAYIQSALSLYRDNHLDPLVYSGDITTYTFEIEKYQWQSSGNNILLSGQNKTRRMFTFLIPITTIPLNLRFEFPYIKKCVSINCDKMLIIPSVPSYQFQLFIENTYTYEFLMFHVAGADS